MAQHAATTHNGHGTQQSTRSRPVESEGGQFQGAYASPWPPLYGCGNLEIGQTETSKPESEISNWTQSSGPQSGAVLQPGSQTRLNPVTFLSAKCEKQRNSFWSATCIKKGETTLYPQGSLVDPLRGVSQYRVTGIRLTPLYFCFSGSSDKLSPCSSPGRSARVESRPN